MLSTVALDQLDTDGFLVVEDVFDPARDFAPVINEYDAVLDGIARTLCATGAIGETWADQPFAERLMRVCAASGRQFGQHFDISLPQAGVQHDTPIHNGPAMFRLLVHPRLLALVEQVLGPEIFSCPVQHIRMKLPQHMVPQGAGSLVSRTPWHQDNGVLLPEADVATILTVWIPLSDATVANGCLQVVPGSHRAGLVDHCPRDASGLAIPDTLIDGQAALPLPMRAGSVLLMNQRTIHNSLANTTRDQVRISLDLRFQPIGQPTGRPAFEPAGFVARSAGHPERELRDPGLWQQQWLALREQLAARADPSYNRWRADAPACA